MKISNKKAKKALEKRKSKAQKIIESESKQRNFIEKADKKLANNLASNKIREIIDYASLLLQMAKSFFKKEYQEIPLGTIIAIVAALLYWIAPIDIIADFIPGIGYVDDASVIAVCLKFVQTDLDKYKEWHDAQMNIIVETC